LQPTAGTHRRPLLRAAERACCRDRGLDPLVDAPGAVAACFAAHREDDCSGQRKRIVSTHGTVLKQRSLPLLSQAPFFGRQVGYELYKLVYVVARQALSTRRRLAFRITDARHRLLREARAVHTGGRTRRTHCLAGRRRCHAAKLRYMASRARLAAVNERTISAEPHRVPLPKSNKRLARADAFAPSSPPGGTSESQRDVVGRLRNAISLRSGNAPIPGIPIWLPTLWAKVRVSRRSGAAPLGWSPGQPLPDIRTRLFHETTAGDRSISIPTYTLISSLRQTAARSHAFAAGAT